MPRLTSIEKQRSFDHLSKTYLKRSLLLSPSYPLSEIPSLSNISDHSIGGNTSRTSSSDDGASSLSSSTSLSLYEQHSSWIMCDDDRIDRFSDNYYRFNWGLHKGGLVLAVFMGLLLVTSLIVGAAYIG
jgi:hypothetical protein